VVCFQPFRWSQAIQQSFFRIETMNFKKIAIVAALLASSSAFAVTDIDVAANVAGADVNALDVAEFAALGTLAGDGNVAFITQEGDGNLAYIDQTAAGLNYASIVQVDGAAIGIVYQIGGTNRAAIYSH
jgi:hypothetical protein